ARQALAIDPDCCDALGVLADCTAKSNRERIVLLEQAVAAGERSLGGQAFFEARRGSFWSLLETRPYMRARSALAGTLQAVGRLKEAAAHYEALLDLNPNDNQGNRELLFGLYFQIDDLAGVRRLLERYEDDASIVYVWSLVLERFLAGDLDGARRALE